MIVIGVTGSRFWWDAAKITEKLDIITRGHDDVLIRHGMCPPRLALSSGYVSWNEALRLEKENSELMLLGADWFADRHACERGWQVDRCPADWGRYGSRAGPIRNKAMVVKEPRASFWLAFLHPSSAGTRNCLGLVRKARIPAFTFQEEPMVVAGGV